MSELMMINAIEQQIFELEQVRVIFREPKSSEVRSMGYTALRALGDDKTIGHLRNRIKKIDGVSHLEFEIVLGNGNSLPHNYEFRGC